MNTVMLRILTFLLAILLALPALAHIDDVPDCQGVVSSSDCGLAVAEMADLLDDTSNREDFGSKAQKHCLLHCVGIASVFDFDFGYESGLPDSQPSVELLLQHGERIPRPPDVVR